MRLKVSGWALALFALFVSFSASAGHLFTQAQANTPINLIAGTGLQVTQLTYEPGVGNGLVTINFNQMGGGDPTLDWSAGDAIQLTIGSYSQTLAYDTLLADATLTGAMQGANNLSATVADATLNAALVGAATTPSQTWTVVATSGQFTFEGYRIYVGSGTFNGTGAGPINQNQVVTADQLPAPGGATDIDTAAASYLASNIGASVNPAFTGGTLQIDSNGTTFSENFTIDDSVNGATSTIDQNGNASTFSGVISDAPGQTGSMTFANSGVGGSVTLTGINTYTGATTINSGAKLVLSGNGSISNSSSVSNAGVLSVAAGKTAVIGGNYTQLSGGVYQTTLSSATSYGKLAVNGNADISASNKIDVSVLGAPSLLPGTLLPSVISASGTLIAGPTFTVTDNSALFNFFAVKNGSAVDLRVLSGTVTALGSVTVARALPATGAATVIDTLIAAGQAAPAGMTDVITALGMLPTQQAVSDAVSQTLPLLGAGMGQVTSGTTHNTNRIVQARMDMNRGLSSGDEFVANKNIWFKPFYSEADQSTVNGVPGFRSSTSGIVMGADGEASALDRIGVAFAYSTSSVKGKSLTPNAGSVESTQGIFYGSHALNSLSEFSYQADVGMHRNTGSRQISFGGLNRVAAGTYDSTSIHAGAGYGRTIQISETSTFAPAVRLDYSNMQDSGYIETGAGGLNLAVQGNTTEALVLSIDGRGVMNLNDHSTISGNLGVGYDTMNRPTTVTSSYVGGGAAFSTTGIKPSPTTLSGGLGVAYTADNGSELLLRYDLEARERFSNQTASMKWRLPF